MNMTVRVVSVLFLPLVLVACATGPEEDTYLSQLQQRYEQLSKREDVRLAAASELLNAEEALDAAENAGSADEREHQLYLARQYLAIAETAAQRRDVEQKMQSLAREQREEELRQARERSRTLESELAALEAKQTDRGLLITLPGVFFETGGDNIPPGASDQIGKLATYLEDHPNQKVVVEGHTDSRGSEQYNLRLSRERADSVKNALVARGISPERITTRGLGESRPIASNQTSGGRQLNRRVEVVLPGASG